MAFFSISSTIEKIKQNGKKILCSKTLKLKFFDGADLKSVENLNREEFIKGFTTNPSLMKKAGVTDYKAFSIDLIKLIEKTNFFRSFYR